MSILSGPDETCETLEESVVGNTRDGLIRSMIQKYHPGIEYATGVSVTEDDEEYYGEWVEQGGVLEFTTECDGLDNEEMAFVILHEIAHSLTHDGYHSPRFYGVLTALVISEGVSWATAIRMEQVTPLLWEPYRINLTSPN